MTLPQIIAVGVFNSQVTHKRAVTQNRKTTMFELELPIYDTGISYIDNEQHKISKNTAICAKPGQLRHTRLPFTCYYIHMIVEKGSLYDMLMCLPNFVEFSDTTHLRKIFEDMCQCYATDVAEDRIMLHSLVLELIYILSKNAAKKQHTAKANNHKAISDALEYIRENLNNKLTLEMVARKTSFSTTYFHRLFKASTGKNLHQYIEDLRIQKAVELLISTNMTLTQIAYECGFSSQSYFSVAFKRNKGTTPKAYVKKLVNLYDE